MAQLNFILLKVNGVDVSQCTHDEAVQHFLSATEPINVELRRRSTGSSSSNSTTETGREVAVVLSVGQQSTPLLNSVGVQTELPEDEAAEDRVFFDDSPVSVNIFDECMLPDVDLEEITLQKSSSQEQLGLTVSYIHCAPGSSIGGGGGSNSGGNNSVKSINEVDSEASTEVYISNILPDSIAARDGRLRQGDQILQVNGRDVSDKEETESLFAENKKAVTLLISRYLSIDDYFENSDDMYSDNELWHDDPADETRLLVDSMNATSVTTPPSAVPTHHEAASVASPKREAALTQLMYHNDPLHHSRVKTHLEVVNKEIQLLDQRMEQLMMAKKADGPPEVYQDPVDSRPTIPRSNSMVERFSAAKLAHQVIDSETEHIYETIPEYSETEPIYCSPHDSHVDLQRMQLLQQQQQERGHPVMRWSKSFSGKDKVKASKTASHLQRSSRVVDNEMVGDNKAANSSPKNTADRGHGHQLTLEFSANERAQCQGATLVLGAPYAAKGNGMGKMKGERTTATAAPAAARTRLPNSMSNGYIQPLAEEKGYCTSNTLPVGTGPAAVAASDTMYTNAANLEQTISLQQEMFRQSMLHQRINGGPLRAQEAATRRLRVKEAATAADGWSGRRKTEDSNQNEKADAEADEGDDGQRMVWKVKRRPDGSRYIVRRPAQGSGRGARNRGEAKAAASHELTTEDDTMSEIKLGRYWNKDERKKHMERARERRSRQEQVLENVRMMQRKNLINLTAGGGTGVAVDESVIMASAGPKLVAAAAVVKGDNGAPGLPEGKDNKIGGLLSVTTV